MPKDLSTLPPGTYEFEFLRDEESPNRQRIAATNADAASIPAKTIVSIFRVIGTGEEVVDRTNGMARGSAPGTVFDVEVPGHMLRARIRRRA